MVPSQLNILMPVGTAMIMVVIMNGDAQFGLQAGEHVVGPDGEADEGDAHAGQAHHAITEDWLAAVHRKHLRQNTHARQHHDVDGRVAVEPEDILPEQHIAAAGRVKKGGCRRRDRAAARVKAPARKGVAMTAMMLVARTAQQSRGMRQSVICGGRILKMVTIKLIEPMMEEMPSRCAPRAQSVWPSPLKSVESGGVRRSSRLRRV